MSTAGPSDECPACGTPVFGTPEACPACGQPFAGEEERRPAAAPEEAAARERARAMIRASMDPAYGAMSPEQWDEVGGAHAPPQAAAEPMAPGAAPAPGAAAAGPAYPPRRATAPVAQRGPTPRAGLAQRGNVVVSGFLAEEKEKDEPQRPPPVHTDVRCWNCGAVIQLRGRLVG